LPYRYPSAAERAAAAEEARRIEVIPTAATATIKMQPGIATVLLQTRQSAEFEAVRRSIRALGENEDSPLLTETRFREAWQGLCTVHAENSARALEPATRWDHRIVQFGDFAYLTARVRGLLLLPALSSLDLAVVEDAAMIATGQLRKGLGSWLVKKSLDQKFKG
jgi:hypothetical protein